MPSTQITQCRHCSRCDGESRTSEAAALVAAIAHALPEPSASHEEYDLQLADPALHDGASLTVSEAHWNLLIGHDVLASDMSLVDFVPLGIEACALQADERTSPMN